MEEAFPELTEDVIARMSGAEPRLRHVMTLLVRHLHAFVREAALTQDEWRTGIAFLRGLGRHPFRPAHVHFMISAPRFRKLVTHLFLKGDKYLESDAVFGVKPSLIVLPVRQGNTLTVTYDFGLARLQDT